MDEAWRMYRAHAAHLLTIAFVIYLVAGLVSALLASVGGALGGFLATVVQIIAAFGVQAALVKAVQDLRDGRADLSLGETVSAASPYIGNWLRSGAAGNWSAAPAGMSSARSWWCS